MLSVIFGYYIVAGSTISVQAFICAVKSIGRMIVLYVVLYLLVLILNIVVSLAFSLPALSILLMVIFVLILYVLAIECAFVIPVVVLEGISLRAAIKRSRYLADGYEGRLFSVYFLSITINLLTVALHVANYPFAVVASILQPIHMGLVVKWYFQSRARYDEFLQMSSLRSEFGEILNTVKRANHI